MKNPWEIEESEASALPAFKVGDKVRRRGEGEVGEVIAYHGESDYYTVKYVDEYGVVVSIRHLHEPALLAAEAPTRFRNG